MDYEKAWNDLFAWLDQRNKDLILRAASLDTPEAAALRLGYKADAIEEVLNHMERAIR